MVRVRGPEPDVPLAEVHAQADGHRLQEGLAAHGVWLLQGLHAF